MSVFGIYLAGCLMLIVAGAAKTIRPYDTARAASIPPFVVRVGAATEVAVGTAAIAVRPLAVALALSYLGFAIFVAWQLVRAEPIATCGCFGTPDTPATRTHIVIDLAVAGAAAVTARARGGLSTQPWHGIPLILAAAACATTAILLMSSAARLAAVRAEIIQPAVAK